jgi:geranylgeranylglycerol-phosphate geranylgeranyltransferase
MPRYYGIKRGYPRVERVFGRIAAYIQLIRVFTLLAPVVVGFFGSLICLGDMFWSRWLEVVYVTFTLMLCQAVGQVVNQACGVDEDRINKPYRPIPSGKITVEEAYGLAFLLTMISLWRGFTISLTFGLWTAVILFFAVFYNLKPFQARKYVWVNLLWMSVSRGLLPLIVIWSAFRSPFELKPWLLGSIAFLWVFAFQTTKDIPDVEGDRRFGIRTLPVVYGVEKTKSFIRWASILPFVPLILYVQSGLLPLTYLLLVNLAVVREIGIWGFDRKMGVTENTLGWVAFYLGLSLIFVLSYIAEVI